MREPNFIAIPATTPEAYCKSCHKPGYWIRTAAGRPMMVDPAVPGGEIPTPLHAGRGFAHFATCPHADSHRRRTKAAAPSDASNDTVKQEPAAAEPSMFATPSDVVAAADLVAKHGRVVGSARILSFQQDARRAAKDALYQAFGTDDYAEVRSAVATLETFHGARW